MEVQDQTISFECEDSLISGEPHKPKKTNCPIKYSTIYHYRRLRTTNPRIKMGVCLCKSKTTDDLPDNISQSATNSGELSRAYGQYFGRYEEMLSETVDRLVKETLKVIGTIVDNDPEPPRSMVQLHDITDKPVGWIQLVKSLIRVVPLEHPMGPSVITLLLDDSPLPTKDSVLEVADMITHSMRRTPRRERNLCVILGCLAEKLAGPSSIAVLSETTLDYLIGNLVSPELEGEEGFRSSLIN